LFSLTYDLWIEIIDDVVEGHAPLFETMHEAAESLDLSSALLDDLKKKGILEIGTSEERLLLKIDFFEDKIEGFMVSLLAAESLEIFETIKAEAVSDHGFSLEDIEGYEVEHGLDMDEEIFAEMEEGYGIFVEMDEDGILFEQEVFNSQDLDNHRENDAAWGHEVPGN
jgi:hypothetical protein